MKGEKNSSVLVMTVAQYKREERYMDTHEKINVRRLKKTA